MRSIPPVAGSSRALEQELLQFAPEELFAARKPLAKDDAYFPAMVVQEALQSRAVRIFDEYGNVSSEISEGTSSTVPIIEARRAVLRFSIQAIERLRLLGTVVVLGALMVFGLALFHLFTTGHLQNVFVDTALMSAL